MKLQYTKSDILIMFAISLGAAVAVQFVEILVLFHFYHHTNRIEILANTFSAFEVGINILSRTVIGMLLFLLNFEILNSFTTFLNSKVRIFIVSPIVTFILSSFLFRFFSFMHVKTNAGDNFINEKIMISPIDYVFLTVVVVFSSNIINITRHRKNMLLENERLRTENLQSKYETLRNQINPHFLFNSLNALNLLIREKPAVAHEYVERLSAVLRYTLTSSEENLVSLSDESSFIKSYIQLLKTRYEENLEVSIEIGPEFSEYKLPPLSLQLLIENAVKHNIISKKNKLHIEITATKEESIKVKNNFSPKLTPEESIGKGLDNLSKRYMLIAGKEIEIIKEHGFFIVEIPLIRNNENNNY